MPENQRISLPMGQGLDRETGVMQMRPGSFEDIRNLLLHQGKSIIRPGFDRKTVLLDPDGDPVSHILQGFPLRSERVGVVVSYQLDTNKCFVHRVDPQGVSAELVGEWENDQTDGWREQVPKVSMAEVYGRIFIAHDTRYVTRRATTIYYDPVAGVSPLNDLEADFEGTGDAPVRFRGVRRHLKYLFGGGFGDEGEDRPELVRSSRAGDPTSFNPEHYWIAGDRRDPVLSCQPAGNRLVVFKEVEAHHIFGSGRDDFGIDILDPQYGVIASGLAANRGGEVIAWSAEGPRVWDGRGPSQEIAIPLELAGAEPPGLVEEGDEESAFAAYIPELRIMAFFFGKRVYALTSRVEGDWKWGYWELETATPLCAFTLFPGPQDTLPPTGYPLVYTIVAGGIYATINVWNINQDGDETLELWLSEDVGAWFLKKTVLVATTEFQAVRIEGLTPGTSNRIALRYRRGLFYTIGYEDPDPTNWPSGSWAQFDTYIAPPTIYSGVWSRIDGVSEKIALTITPAVGQETQDIKIYRNTVLVHTISGPHVGDATWDDTGITGETEVSYEFVTVGGSGDSIKSDPLLVWAGPLTIPVIEWLFNMEVGGNDHYEIRLDPGDVTMETEVHDNYDGAGGTGAYALRMTLADGEEILITGVLAGVPASPGVEIGVKIRHKDTQFAVDDFGDFSEVSLHDLIAL